MRLGSWLRNVTQSPSRRSTRKIVLKNFVIICRSSIPTGDTHLRASSIHLAEYAIQGPKNRHHVGHQATPHHPVERLQIDERGRPHAHPVWLRGIVADNEVA